MNISPAQVGKIENIKHNAIDEVKEAVSSGKVSIAVANNIAGLDEEKQEELIAQKDISKLTNKDVDEKKNEEGYQIQIRTNKQKKTEVLKLISDYFKIIKTCDDDRFNNHLSKLISELKKLKGDK